MNILNEIKKGKMILSGMKKEQENRRNNLSKDLSDVTFYSDWFNTWKGFRNHILKNCQSLEKICNKYRSNSKSLSTPYFDDISEKCRNLQEIMKFENITLLPILTLGAYNTGFKALSDSCYSVYKAKFTTSFGAVLNHTPTKKDFLRLRNDLIDARKKFNYFYLESVKCIIEFADNLVKCRKFDKDINETIYIPDSKFEKYIPFKISTNFARYDDDKNKTGNLKQVINSIKEKLKNYKYIVNVIVTFLNKNLDKKFIDSLQSV